MLTNIDYPAKDKTYYINDDGPGSVQGHRLCITPNGVQTYKVRYTIDGIERTKRTGSRPMMTLARSRKQALKIKARVRLGEDPQGELVAARRAPTVKEMVERYKDDHLPRSEASQREYKALIEIIAKKLGNRNVASIEFADISKIHRDMKDSPYRANSLYRIARRVFGFAVKWQMIDRNPCTGVDLFPEHNRERYLSEAELAALLSALDKHGDQTVANIIRLLILTGSRRGEVLSAKWDDFDLDAAMWTKPAPSIKTNKLSRVQLSEEAVELLRGIKRSGEYI
ncbi:MAG: tyrosine-type recombinase/integrase, partial [Candidatus Binatia bacterium]